MEYWRITAADKPLICGAIEFEAWNYGEPRQRFRLRAHPDIGREVDALVNGEWQTVARRPETLDRWLPADVDGRAFMISWHCWAEGHERGFAEGEHEAAQRFRQHVEPLRRYLGKWAAMIWRDVTRPYRLWNWKRADRAV